MTRPSLHDEAAAYYAQELESLAATGERLSVSHPSLARHLARQANNPDIERLVEGTAYLCSVVQARIDACAPESTQALADMMAPWVHRDMPAAMVAGIDVPITMAADVAVLPAGTGLKTASGNHDLAFQTTQPVTLLPVRVLEQRVSSGAGGEVTLTLTMQTSGRLTQQMLVEHGLTFYIDGPIAQAQLLAMSLWHASYRAELHDGGSFSALAGAIDAPCHHLAPPLTPVFPDDPPLQAGVARLRDHFLLPHKNLFVTFRLATAAAAELNEFISLTLTCGSTLGLTDELDGVMLRLHAVPAINLRRMDGMPIRSQPTQTRYVLRPQHDAAEPYAKPLLAVDQVTFVGEHNHTATSVPPLHSYRWAHKLSAPPTHSMAMHTLRLPQQGDGPAHLHLHHPVDVPMPLTPGTISSSLWCHDGPQAAGHPPQTLHLQVNHERGYRATNLTASTAVVPPPPKNSARYAVLSLTAQRSRGAIDKIDLLRTLQLLACAHDPKSAAYRAQQLAIDSIADVHTACTTRRWHGAQVLCLDVYLTLEPKAAHTIAEAYFFAEALAQLWADAQPVNGVMRLTLTCPQWGRNITWPLRSGNRTFGELTCTFGDEPR